MTVLIIEPDSRLAMSLCEVLLDEGYSAVVRSTLLSAREYMERENPALLLLESRLPDGDGCAFLSSARIRRRIPAIVFAPRGAFGESVRALEAGADDFMTWPISPREVVARVRALARRIDFSR